MARTETPASLGTVVVVGGCGFLGHHIVNYIVKRYPQTQVAVVDLRTNANRNASLTVSYHGGDITDLNAMRAIFSQIKPDALIHTATPDVFGGKHEVFDKVNVTGTKNLVKAAQESGVKAFVYTSSASVVLDAKAELINADERWPIVAGPAQPEYYTTTKAYAETAVLEANRNPENFLTCAIRPAGIIGEGDVQVLPKMVTAFRKGQTKFQVGDNNNLFDFTYVENIAHGHVLALIALLQTQKMSTKPLDTERVDGEAFFITNGEPVYFWDFARAVWHEAGDRLPLSSVWHLSADTAWAIGTVLEWAFWIMGKTPNLTRAQVRYSSMSKYHNINKAKSRLGYEPLVSLDEGIRRGVQYILAQEQKESQKKGQ